MRNLASVMHCNMNATRHHASHSSLTEATLCSTCA